MDRHTQLMERVYIELVQETMLNEGFMQSVKDVFQPGKARERKAGEASAALAAEEEKAERAKYAKMRSDVEARDRETLLYYYPKTPPEVANDPAAVKKLLANMFKDWDTKKAKEKQDSDFRARKKAQEAQEERDDRERRENYSAGESARAKYSWMKNSTHPVPGQGSTYVDRSDYEKNRYDPRQGYG